MVRSHLVVLKREYLEGLLGGEKRIEARLTKTRRAPFGRIGRGDRLFFKVSSGLVLARGEVGRVLEFENLDGEGVAKLRGEYDGDIRGSDEYWADKRDSKWAVLVWVENVEAIGPMRIDKKDWRAWVVLSEKENFGLRG
jgi:ASC-1-like (ASCH) protein